MTKYDIKQSGDDVHVIGFTNWSPEHWDYQTSDSDIDSLLGEVKAKGEVTGYTFFEDEDAIYCFVEDKVESSSPKFIGLLSDYLVRVTEIPSTRSIWIMERNNTGD